MPDRKKYFSFDDTEKSPTPTENKEKAKSLSLADYLRLGGSTVARVGGGIAGTVGGGILGTMAGPGPGTAIGAAAGGAAGSAAGEYLGQLIEGNPVSHKRAAVSGALGAVPGSMLIKAGKPLASAAASGLMGYVGAAGMKAADGVPIEKAVNPTSDAWSASDLIMGPVLGGAIGGAFGHLTKGAGGGGGGTPTPKPNTEGAKVTERPRRTFEGGTAHRAPTPEDFQKRNLPVNKEAARQGESKYTDLQQSDIVDVATKSAAERAKGVVARRKQNLGRGVQEAFSDTRPTDTTPVRGMTLPKKVEVGNETGKRFVVADPEGADVPKGLKRVSGMPEAPSEATQNALARPANKKMGPAQVSAERTAGKAAQRAETAVDTQTQNAANSYQNRINTVARQDTLAAAKARVKEADNARKLAEINNAKAGLEVGPTRVNESLSAETPSGGRASKSRSWRPKPPSKGQGNGVPVTDAELAEMGIDLGDDLDTGAAPVPKTSPKGPKGTPKGPKGKGPVTPNPAAGGPASNVDNLRKFIDEKSQTTPEAAQVDPKARSARVIAIQKEQRVPFTEAERLADAELTVGPPKQEQATQRMSPEAIQSDMEVLDKARAETAAVEAAKAAKQAERAQADVAAVSPEDQAKAARLAAVRQPKDYEDMELAHGLKTVKEVPEAFDAEGNPVRWNVGDEAGELADNYSKRSRYATSEVPFKPGATSHPEGVALQLDQTTQRFSNRQEFPKKAKAMAGLNEPEPKGPGKAAAAPATETPIDIKAQLKATLAEAQKRKAASRTGARKLRKDLAAERKAEEARIKAAGASYEAESAKSRGTYLPQRPQADVVAEQARHLVGKASNGDLNAFRNADPDVARAALAQIDAAPGDVSTAARKALETAAAKGKTPDTTVGNVGNNTVPKGPGKATAVKDPDPFKARRLAKPGAAPKAGLRVKASAPKGEGPTFPLETEEARRKAIKATEKERKLPGQAVQSEIEGRLEQELRAREAEIAAEGVDEKGQRTNVATPPPTIDIDIPGGPSLKIKNEPEAIKEVLNRLKTGKWVDYGNQSGNGKVGKQTTSVWGDIAERVRNLTTDTMASRGPGSGGQRGAIALDPQLLMKMGGTAGGAMLGAGLDDEDPLKGALLGGGAGFGLAHGAGKLRGDMVKPAFDAVVDRLPNYQRASLLSDPINLLYNSVAGPYGSGIMGGLEQWASGNPAGKALFKDLVGNPLTGSGLRRWMKRYAAAQPEAARRINEAERAGMTPMKHDTKFDRIMSGPGRFMTAGDIATRETAMAHGFPEDITRRMTLTADPRTAYGKGLDNLTKAKDDDKMRSTLLQMMFPFKRTALNIFESGMERLPGVGLATELARRARGSSMSQENRAVMAQQGIGAGAFGIGYMIGSMTPEGSAKSLKLQNLLSNFGGQYSLVANSGFAMGQAARRGKDQTQSLVSAIGQGLPLPQPLGIDDLKRSLWPKALDFAKPNILK